MSGVSKQSWMASNMVSRFFLAVGGFVLCRCLDVCGCVHVAGLWCVGGGVEL